MKKLARILFALSLMAICSLSGCASNTITIPAINAKDVELDKGREIYGESCGFQLLLVIPININGRLQSAYEQLQGQAGREPFANLRIDESWTYAFVGTVYCTKLTATAYPKKPVAVPEAPRVSPAQQPSPKPVSTP